MDIYDYLKMDHAKVSALFKQFEHSESMIRKKEIVNLIAQELLAHAESEQQTFYALLQQHESLRDKIAHAEEEHQKIESLINKVSNKEITDAQWFNNVLELKKTVQHHVKEEEGEIFRNAKKVLSSEEAYRLKERMHYLKAERLMHPHGQLEKILMAQQQSSAKQHRMH